MWNVNLGYGNAAVAEASARALRDASYLTVWGAEHAYARRAAAALLDLAGPQHYSRVLFSTSGGAANDAAMKLARHYQALSGHAERKIVLGLKGGYHGLTFGSFALSDVGLGAAIYGVDRRAVGHVPPNDEEELERVLEHLDARVAAIFVEPVIGNGAIPLRQSFIDALLANRKRYGYLLVADEIATGFYRSGAKAFASATWLEPPDILLAAKAMTNGAHAASALLVSPRVHQAFKEGAALLGHAETQAGTPVVCASVLATIVEMERLGAGVLSAGLASRLGSGLTAMCGRIPFVASVSGEGCMSALNLRGDDGSQLSAQDVYKAVDEIFAAGAIVHPGPSSILVIPALVYNKVDLEELYGCIGNGLTRFAARRGT
jgi:hypothetical protein